MSNHHPTIITLLHGDGRQRVLHQASVVYPKQGQILLSMPFFLTDPVPVRRPGPDSCAGMCGASADLGCSGFSIGRKGSGREHGGGGGWYAITGLNAGRKGSRGVAVCSLVSGVICSDVGRVSGITATLGTEVDGSCSCWP